MEIGSKTPMVGFSEVPDGNGAGLERGLHGNGGQAASAQPSDGAEMKIYLLMLLIGALFTAIHFTQAPDTDAKPVSQ